MSENNNGKYICGYCEKETPLEDLEIMDYAEGKLEFETPCTCGHFSYASSIKFKAELKAEEWKISYRSCA